MAIISTFQEKLLFKTIGGKYLVLETGSNCTDLKHYLCVGTSPEMLIVILKALLVGMVYTNSEKPTGKAFWCCSSFRFFERRLQSFF
jgi:hypothetical protein